MLVVVTSGRIDPQDRIQSRHPLNRTAVTVPLSSKLIDNIRCDNVAVFIAYMAQKWTDEQLICWVACGDPKLTDDVVLSLTHSKRLKKRFAFKVGVDQGCYYTNLSEAEPGEEKFGSIVHHQCYNFTWFNPKPDSPICNWD